MFEAIDSSYLVPFDGTFKLSEASTTHQEDTYSKKESKNQLEDMIKSLSKRQRLLAAQDKYSILLVFQAMDAAGKDGTIRAVTRGLNPAGFQVFSFKQPSTRDLDHDFLWRTARCLPERGRIGIFNRSYYEEVLVVRVHPEYLKAQRLPEGEPSDALWSHRYESIRDHEKHLARNGTIILKFWLNVSPEEQRKRFLDRIEDERKNWKFSEGDVRERGFWDNYMDAYEKALNATSRPWAPWYAIPADDKPTMRVLVCDIIKQTMDSLHLHYPTLSDAERKRLSKMKDVLEKPSS